MSWLRFTGLDRFSPFTRSPPQGSSTVSDADYSYITSDDLKRHAAQASAEEQDGKRDTDILHVRVSREVYNLHFAAYAISRGELKIGDLRDAVARKLGVRSRRVELHYRGRKLAEDSQRCIDVGLKDGSELLGAVDDINASSGTEDSEDDSGTPNTRSATKKKRKNRSSRNKKKRQATEGGSSADVLDVPPQQQRISSPARPQDPLKMGTALEKLTALFAVLHSFDHDVQAFLRSPPSDASKREFEHKRLSETILTQVLLKTDAVETEGDADARARRKELVKETQNVLKSLDEANGTTS